MKHEIIFSGYGGQGLLVVSKLLAQAAVQEGNDALFFPVYGGSIRGGPVHTTTIVSDEPILSSPIVESPSAAVFMAEYGYELFADHLQRGAMLILNSSLIDKAPDREDIRVHRIPASKLAEQTVGNIVAASMVALGAFNVLQRLVSEESLLGAMEEVLPPYRHKLIPVNQRAIQAGAEYARSMTG